MIAGGFIGLSGHIVKNPHGVGGVYWRKNIHKLRKLTAEYARRCRNA